MADSLFKCKRCGLEGEYYSTGKTLCPVTRKVVCDACAEAAQERASPKAFTHFGGATYDPARDRERLSEQQRAVIDVMKDGRWYTIPQVAEAIGAPPESINAIGARIRDIRKIYNRKDAVERRHVSGGLWEYRAHIEVAA